VATGKCASLASVEATPKSLIDSANTMASEDQIAGASSAATVRVTDHLPPPCTRTAASNSSPSPRRPAEIARYANGMPFTVSTPITPTGPNSRPRATLSGTCSRSSTPEGSSSRSQPSAIR